MVYVRTCRMTIVARMALDGICADLSDDNGRADGA